MNKGDWKLDMGEEESVRGKKEGSLLKEKNKMSLSEQVSGGKWGGGGGAQVY